MCGEHYVASKNDPGSFLKRKVLKYCDCAFERCYVINTQNHWLLCFSSGYVLTVWYPACAAVVTKVSNTTIRHSMQTLTL